MPTPWRIRTNSQLLEQVDAVERARAQITILTERLGAAAFHVAALDVHRATPVLRRFGGFQCPIAPLGLPVLEIHLFERAVEVLDIDGTVVFIDGDNLEGFATVETIPIADTRMRSRHLAGLLHARSMCL